MGVPVGSRTYAKQGKKALDELRRQTFISDLPHGFEHAFQPTLDGPGTRSPANGEPFARRGGSDTLKRVEAQMRVGPRLHWNASSQNRIANPLRDGHLADLPFRKKKNKGGLVVDEKTAL